MNQIRLRSIEKRFGSFVAISRLDLDVQQGELMTLLGPSGCGKTTTLRMIAGLELPSAGRIELAGLHVLHERGEGRRVAGTRSPEEDTRSGREHRRRPAARRRERGH